MKARNNFNPKQRKDLMPEAPKGEIIMMGKRERVPGWQGEIFVAVVKVREGSKVQYQVICDSTDSRDLDQLPEIKIFEDKMEAFNYAMEMERNKNQWKSGR